MEEKENRIDIKENLKNTKENLKKLAKHVTKMIIPALVVMFVFVILLFVANAKIEELEAKLRAALQETEHIEITNIHIEEKLSQISELATMSFEYTNQKTIDNTREILDVEIPGTTNTVDIIYSGVIKVGYDVSDITYEIDENRKILVFELPEPEVLDNYIILDDLRCDDKNNIFNPIGTEDITRYFEEIQQEELTIAEENGIYEQAEEQIELLIKNFFAAFSDYKILFTN